MEGTINKPLVSIAVATYNGEKYLIEQLNTLVNQTYPNIEIIISDDDSTDGTMKILKDYEKKYSFISIKENTAPNGIKRNFENALKYCRGEYIAFSDQDDIWMLDKIEKLVNNIGNHALIYHDSLFVDTNANSLGKTFSSDLRCYSGTNSEAFLLCNCVSGHALLFNRKLLSIVLPFPNARHHDWWLAFRATEHGGVQFFNEVLVHYRQHAFSQTDFLRIKKEALDLEKIERDDIEWFEACAAVPSKHQLFYKKWVKYFKVRNENIFNWHLFSLSILRMNDLFYMRRKNKISTFLNILKRSWGENIKHSFRNKKKTLLGN
ncbi:MAG: glycosyltransferase family 2 protein [Ferruginibacter sp.]|nr:glycosyltransferase family 2 protein [Ferruginibacter sp.]